MSLPQHPERVDWTSRQLKPGKRGTIARNGSPILDLLKLSAELRVHAVEEFGKRRVGSHNTLALEFSATAQTASLPIVAR